MVEDLGLHQIPMVHLVNLCSDDPPTHAETHLSSPHCWQLCQRTESSFLVILTWTWTRSPLLRASGMNESLSTVIPSTLVYQVIQGLGNSVILSRPDLQREPLCQQRNKSLFTSSQTESDLAPKTFSGL